MKKIITPLLLAIFMASSVISQTGFDCMNSKPGNIGFNQVDHQGTNDQWFAVYAMNAGDYTIKQTGEQFAKVEIVTGATCPGTPFLSDDGANGIDITYTAAANEVFWVVFRYMTGVAATYGFDIIEGGTGGGGDGTTCETAKLAFPGTHQIDNPMIDQWFVYTAVVAGPLTVTANTVSSVEIQLLSGTCTSTTTLTSDNNTVISLTQNLVMGEKVWILVKPSSNTAFPIQINDGNGGTGGTGEICENAIMAFLGANNVDHQGGTIDQWFEYTATVDGPITVRQNGEYGTYAQIMVGGTCGTSWAAKSDDGNDNLIDMTYEAMMGEKIWILFKPSATLTTYSFELIEGSGSGSGNPGEACNNPIVANVGSNSCDHTGGFDQWFSFSPPTSGWYEISNCADVTSEDTYVELFGGNGCNTWWITENDDACGFKSSLIFEAYPGDNYMIKWNGPMMGYASGTYNFTIASVTPPAGIKCESAHTATLGSNNVDHQGGSFEQWFKYTATNDAVIEITQTGVEGTMLELMTGDCMKRNYVAMDDGWGDMSINVSYVAAAGEEILMRWGIPSMTYTYSFNISENTNVPAGISCNNPHTAALGPNVTTHANGYDQWYAYEVTESSLFTVSNCADPTMEDTHVEVYMGSNCGDYWYLADDWNSTCDMKSELNFIGYTGDKVLIRWFGSNSGYASGSYTWNLTKEVLPPGTNCQDVIVAKQGDNIANHKQGAFDQYFVYTATADAIVTVSSCGKTTDDTYLELMKGDCMMYKEYTWNDNACDLQSEAAMVVSAGEKLFIRWAKWNGADTYTFTITEDTNIPAGVSCANAIQAQVGDNTANHQGGKFDQWYTYTPTQTSIVSVSSCGATEKSNVELMIGQCDKLNFVNNGWGNCNNGQSEASYIVGAGETLYIKWASEQSATAYTWTLSVNTNLPPGVSCSSPITAAVGPNSVTHQGFAKWYSYTVVKDGFLKVFTCDQTNEDTQVEVYRNCDDAAKYMTIASGYDECDWQSSVSFAVTAGETYLFKWNDWGNIQNTYNFIIEELTDLPPGMICANPIIAASGSNTSDHTDGQSRKWYKYTATLNGKLNITASSNANMWIQAYKGACEPNGEWVNTYGNGLETWVTTGTEVYFMWEVYDPISLNYTITETAAALPKGSYCGDPLLAKEGLNEVNLMNGKQWAKFSATATGVIEIRTMNTWQDAYFEVYPSCTGDMVAFGGGMPAKLELDVTSGTDYYIKWYDHMPSMMQYQIEYLSAVSIEVAVTVTNATCGQENGSATATATGGAEPYTYQWSSGSTEALADKLKAGSYVVTVVDANGEEVSKSVNVNDNSGLAITETVTNVKCKGVPIGAIDITATGGTAPYTYEWSNGKTTADITDLAAGPYEITVMDANGCSVIKSITVTAPPKINVSFTKTLPTCGKSDGSATVVVAGGTSPYTYAWQSGSTTATRSNIGSGVYNITITDANQCIETGSVQINDKNAPVISVDSVIQATCGSSDADIFISVSTTGDLDDLEYLWSSGSTNEDLINVGPGLYSLTVTDTSSKCKAVISATIEGTAPDTAEICMVTVDPETGRNQIVWSPVGGDVESYNIYKETTQAGVYNYIASVPSTELSTFIDTVANPRTRSWRYKITSVDACGNESPKSAMHKTMHLTLNYGFTGEINMIWDGYKGFDYLSYSVYRIKTDGTEVLMETIPSTLTSYTDMDPQPDTKTYFVVVEKGSSCLAEVGTKANAGPFSRALSNLEDNRLQSTNGINSNTALEVSVYPNPTDGIVNVSFNESVNINSISVMDITGKLLSTHDVNGQNAILDISSFASGIYFMEIKSENATEVIKLVKE